MLSPLRVIPRAVTVRLSWTSYDGMVISTATEDTGTSLLYMTVGKFTHRVVSCRTTSTTITISTFS